MSTPISLATVTADAFKPLIGATFAITLSSGQSTRGVLSSVAERGLYPGARRAPFSLFFEIPAEAGQPPTQGTLQIEHESVGSLPLFAVPIGKKDDTVTWEIVFG
jgi:hypothetical protein